ncbi:unnamed protein product, partial [Effrenium voratum]
MTFGALRVGMFAERAPAGIACGDFESELSKLKSQRMSNADCDRKLREQDSAIMTLEQKLEESSEELRLRTADLEAEKRRTCSLSTMLLDDTVKEQKLMDQVQSTEERLSAAQSEIQRLVCASEQRILEKEQAAEELRLKGLEAADLAQQLEAMKEHWTKNAAELRFQGDLLEEKRLENKELTRHVAQRFMETEDLRGCLSSCHERCARLEGALQLSGSEQQLLRQKLQQREAELEQSQRQVLDMSSELGEKSQLLTAALGEKGLLAQQLDDARAQLAESEAQLGSLSSSLELAQLESRRIAQHLEAAQMAAEDLLGPVWAFKRQAEAMHQEVAAQRARVEEEESKARHWQQEYEKVAARSAELESVGATSREQILALQDQRDALAQEAQQVRELAAKAEEGELQARDLAKKSRESEELARAQAEEKDILARDVAAKAEESEELLRVKSEENAALTLKLAVKLQESEQLAQDFATRSEENEKQEQDLAAATEEKEALALQLSHATEQVAHFEQQVLELHSSLNLSQVQNASLAQALEWKAMEAEHCRAQLGQQKLHVAALQQSFSALKARDAKADSLDADTTDGRDSEREEICMQREEMLIRLAAEVQAKKSAMQEVCAWQINAELCTSFVRDMSRQRD